MSDEADNQARIRIGLARQDLITWRNNSGVLLDLTGRPVRYGLANDSQASNAVLKSADLIGIGPGGRFLSIEVKATGWKYRGTLRERAQAAWRDLVIQRGGLAMFATSIEEVMECISDQTDK